MVENVPMPQPITLEEGLEILNFNNPDFSKEK